VTGPPVRVENTPPEVALAAVKLPNVWAAAPPARLRVVMMRLRCMFLVSFGTPPYLSSLKMILVRRTFGGES